MNTLQPFTISISLWLSVLVIFPVRLAFLYILGIKYQFKYFAAKNLLQLLLALPIKQTSKRAIKMESDGLRMFLVFYVFGFFVITANYKAALSSYTTIPVVPNPIGMVQKYRVIHQL